LVAEGVPAEDDRLCPVRHEARDVPDDDLHEEDHFAEGVADRAVGERSMRLSPNSSTRASSGVIVAHLTPWRAIASAVIWSLVASREPMPRS
jgi:hypothetical protein